MDAGSSFDGSSVSPGPGEKRYARRKMAARPIALRERRVQETSVTEPNVKVDEPNWARPYDYVQYLNAGSVSVESTPGMLWTFVTTDSRRFSRASALMRATMSESPVVPMISWISGTAFNALMVFCVSVDRMRRYALLA